MTLFRASNKRVRRIPLDSPEASRYLEAIAEMDLDLKELNIVSYSAPASVVRDRLELMGFTRSTAFKVFERAVRVEEARHLRTIASIGDHLGPDFEDDDAPVLKELNAEDWMKGLQEIRQAELCSTNRFDPSTASLPPLIRYMLRHRWLGFPSYEIRHAIRLALDVCSDDEVIYDLTDLVLGEVFGSAEEMVAYADYLSTEDVAHTRPVIVLTEGTTDKLAIERSLALLFPHLVDHFRFMDFEGARVAGGAGPLAAMVKAFVGAGISNRVIALFDNDTAATAALRPLAHIAIPPNIKVLQYPQLALAAAYPTLGPSGVAVMDVNGLAGSIELYLGRDVLETGTGFAPVQWKGFDESLRRYQGEITGKAAIQERFHAKVRAAGATPGNNPDLDWSGMTLVLDQLRTAFHDDDAAELLANENEPANGPA
jgi:hypothetical protein